MATYSENNVCAVNVFTTEGYKEIAYIEPATGTDIVKLDLRNWHCDWVRFYSKADFGCEGIFKLTFDNKILGLIHAGLFPYPCPNNKLKYCQGNQEGEIVVLDALESAIDYYREKVMMEENGWVTIAPGEEGYAFNFKQSSATEFCQRIESKYGIADSST